MELVKQTKTLVSLASVQKRCIEKWSFCETKFLHLKSKNMEGGSDIVCQDVTVSA